MDSKSSTSELKRWRVRARLYGVTLVVVLSYLLIGRLSSGDQKWVYVDLPMSAAAVLVLGLAAVEAYFVIQSLQRRYRALQAARANEIELAERLSEQRRNILNQISRTLLDKLNLKQLPPDVVEKVALLFEADIVGVWLAERSAPSLFVPRGVCGLAAAAARELSAPSGTPRPVSRKSSSNPANSSWRISAATPRRRWLRSANAKAWPPPFSRRSSAATPSSA